MGEDWQERGRLAIVGDADARAGAARPYGLDRGRSLDRGARGPAEGPSPFDGRRCVYSRLQAKVARPAASSLARSSTRLLP